MKYIDHLQTGLRAWVVFSGQTDMNWLRIFKPGFRHCYVILNDGKNWTSVDALSSYMDVSIHNLPPHFDLPLWLQDRGLKVVPVKITREPRQAPWMLFTCVEATKRLLGIRKRWIVTPWQLYRFLKKKNLENISDPKGEFAWAV